LRRGILYTTAEELGCNKIALGHHRDDALETLLMNMFYSGRIQSMPAIYRTNDDRFDVIRPLIECAESEIAEYAQLKEFPILPCNLCGSQDGLKRVEMKKLLTELELKNPGIRDVMLASMKHVRPSHLLDLELNDRLNGVGTVSKLEGADPLSELEEPRPQLVNIEG
jgi:tRNA 2-thiocytidine biosynthesis protein TtcA